MINRCFDYRYNSSRLQRMFPVTETMYESSVHRQEEYISFPSKENETFIGSLVQAEYNVLGGIANSSPFRPDTGGEGLFYFIGNFVEIVL